MNMHHRHHHKPHRAHVEEKRTVHFTRSAHAVHLPRESAWRVFEQRTGIDPDDDTRPVWVQTGTMTKDAVYARRDELRAKKVKRAA